MQLELVRSGKFNSVYCDFYSSEDEIWMTREQIGAALEYDDPRDAIAKIHRRNRDRLDKFSGVVKLSTPSGVQETYVYSAKGVYEICRWSRQPKADTFVDWAWEIIEAIRTGKAGMHGEGMEYAVRQLVKAVDTLTSVVVDLKQVISNKDGLQLPTSLEAEADYMRLNNNPVGDKRKGRYAISSVERLKCHDEVISMLVSRRYTLREIVSFIESQGEGCSRSALDRYRHKLKLGKVKDNGSFEVIAKSGRIISYHANDKNGAVYKIG